MGVTTLKQWTKKAQYLVICTAALSWPAFASVDNRVMDSVETAGDWVSYSLTEPDSRFSSEGEYWASNKSSNQNTSLTLYYNEYRSCRPSLSIRIEGVDSDDRGGSHRHATETIAEFDSGETISLRTDSSYHRGNEAILISLSGNLSEITGKMRAGNSVSFKVTGGVFNGQIEPSFSLAGFTAASSRAEGLCRGDREGAPTEASEIEL